MVRKLFGGGITFSTATARLREPFAQLGPGRPSTRVGRW